MSNVFRRGWATVCLGLLLLATLPLAAENRLSWSTNANRVEAEIQDWSLQTLLGEISGATSWEVYVEPGTHETISAKFKDLTTDEALRRLLGKVSYARIQTNGVTQLLVFRTEARAATQLAVAEKKATPKKNYRIANELIVRLKSNASVSIEDLAKRVKGKIVGRNDRLKLYRLQFADAAAAEAARAILYGIDDVAGVESNYSVDPPAPAEVAAAPAGTQFDLHPKDLGPCSKIVGLIDTPIQPQPGMEKYLLPAVSVVGNATYSSSEPTHGTGMFETMLGAMANSPSKVLPVVVYSSGEQTTTYEVTQGIITAVNAGANPINLSLGGTGDSPMLHSLIQEASKRGVVFVAAAGNEPGKTLTYPAAYPEVLAITAASQNGQLAPYANSGDFVKAMAPGSTVVSLNGQLWLMQGTSVSSAYVSGLIAGKAVQDCGQPNLLADQIIAGLPVKQ